MAVHRLKKQELAFLAESAKEVLRDVEDSVKRDLSTSLQSSEGSVAEQQTKPCSERAKIIICIQDKDGSKQFRVFMVSSCHFPLKIECAHGFCMSVMVSLTI